MMFEINLCVTRIKDFQDAERITSKRNFSRFRASQGALLHLSENAC